MYKKSFQVLLLIFFINPLIFASDTTHIEVSFKSGNNTLHGKLVLPKSVYPVAAMVFIVGSGNSSYKSNYRDMTTLFEKNILPQNVALLYFDKRGVNQSEGKWQTTDFIGRAEDALAAVRWLKTLPQIDASKVGLIGHSQGGWICEIAAGKYGEEIAFIISTAGSTTSVFEQQVEDYQSEYLCRGYSLSKANKKAIRKTKLTYIISNLFSFTQPNLKQLKVIHKFSPDQYIKNIQCTSLFLFGENDELVYPENSIKRLNQIYQGKIPSNISYFVVPGANHSFKVSQKCYKGKLGSLPFAVEFIEHLKAFITKIY